MSGLGAELIVLLVIFLLIGAAFIAVIFGEKSNTAINDSEKDIDKLELPSIDSGNKKKKKNNK
jgi:hypothetical protein